MGPLTAASSSAAGVLLPPLRQADGLRRWLGQRRGYETHHSGLAIITDKMHSQVTAPGYSLLLRLGASVICRAIRGTRPASTTRSTCGCLRTMPTIISGTARRQLNSCLYGDSKQTVKTATGFFYTACSEITSGRLRTRKRFAFILKRVFAPQIPKKFQRKLFRIPVRTANEARDTTSRGSGIKVRQSWTLISLHLPRARGRHRPVSCV